jgi:type II secretion system (T2SS) protein E
VDRGTTAALDRTTADGTRSERSVFGRQVAEYLLEQGWITSAQIEEASRTQGFFGGQIETHLLKLGFVSESVLGEALTEVAGVPFASWERLRSAPPSALGAMSVRLIEKHRVCPFRLEEGRLRIATLAPRDAVALREIQTATGHAVEPWVTIEPRLYQALERHFRLRFEGTKGISLPPGPGDGPRVRPKPAAEDGTAPRSTETEIGLDGRPLDAEVSIDDDAYVRSIPVEAAEPSSMAALDNALSKASDRDELAEALFAFCAGRSSRSGLFAVGKDSVRGVAGRGRAFTGEDLRKLTVPVGSGTLFDTALQSRDFYFGVVPALPANRDLYTALGGKLPANVMLLPIVVKERTVALLYLDGDDGALPRPDIPAMRRVAAKAGLAFEMLLLRKKLREI